MLKSHQKPVRKAVRKQDLIFHHFLTLWGPFWAPKKASKKSKNPSTLGRTYIRPLSEGGGFTLPPTPLPLDPSPANWQKTR